MRRSQWQDPGHPPVFRQARATYISRWRVGYVAGKPGVGRSGGGVEAYVHGSGQAWARAPKLTREGACAPLRIRFANVGHCFAARMYFRTAISRAMAGFFMPRCSGKPPLPSTPILEERVLFSKQGSYTCERLPDVWSI